ncbi:MAG: hypothetical protein WBQ18_20020 [Solirubrobacteraceae bacterium]
MKRLATLFVLLGLTLLPGTAFADSTCQQYSSEVCSAHNVAGQQAARASTTVAATNASTLPFTGLDVVLLAAGGATLLGAGVVVRHLSRGAER